jgi:hypothetical protein
MDSKQLSFIEEILEIDPYDVFGDNPYMSYDIDEDLQKEYVGVSPYEEICGYVNKDLTIQDRSWLCPRCGTEHQRDENAAINLKNIALNIFNVAESNVTEGSSGSAAARRNGNHLQ